VSTARTARARKLLAVETSRVAARERDLADARLALEAREAAAAAAEAEARAADGRWLDLDAADDLGQASAHRHALATRVLHAKRAVTEAVAEVRAKELAAIDARIAERRFEILIEGFLRADAAREQKVERRVSDEHAARRREAS
jgi:hypothetical protein